MRVAVQPGASAVRVARHGPDGAARVVGVPADPGVPPARLLRGLLDDGAGVRTVDGDGAAVLLAAGRSVLVVDVGAAGTVVSRVHGRRVVARRSAPGGERFDRAVAALLVARDPTWAGDGGLLAEARRVREALSLRPEVPLRGGAVLAAGGSPGGGGAGGSGDPAGGSRDRAVGPRGGVLTAAEAREALGEPWDEIVAVARVLAGGPAVPVLLAGGGARSPDLAERFDAAGFADVTVAPRPDEAAVLAALDLPGARAAPVVRTPVRWLPPVPRRARRPWRTGAAALGVSVVLGALHLLGTLVPAAPDLPTGMLAQYGYRLAVPDGWSHTGGLPERRRSLLTPAAAPDGSDLIAVESTPLGYDAGAEPGRAAAELRAEFDAAGPDLSGYDPAAQVGGRAVTAYRERDGSTEVRWYVVLDGDTQLSVGCRHTPAGRAAVLAACEQVVASIRSDR